MKTNDEIYIGWQSHAPAGIGRRVRGLVIVLALLAIVFALLVARSQKTIGSSVFEWGHLKTFSGILKLQPYPHLQVSRPGRAASAFSSYYLVAPFKFGLDAEKLATLADKEVKLKGTLIYRGNQTMIEAQPESILPLQNGATPNSGPVAAPVELGRQTLMGEIVDSKCYLGVMNPGQLTPHRACAVRCISGGIPPVLLVRREDAPTLYFLLVSTDGRPVNKEVLEIVAEPVEVTGDVTKQGDLLILRADPSSFHHLKN